MNKMYKTPPVLIKQIGEVPTFPNQILEVERGLIEAMTFDLGKQFDRAFEEGLKRKGFEFDNDNELIEFVKEHCRCEDVPSKCVKTYLVDDEPFLIYKYNPKLEFTGVPSVGIENMVNLSFGEFLFIPE